MKNLAIKGSDKYGNKIIEILENLGANNVVAFDGCAYFHFYSINDNNEITALNENEVIENKITNIFTYEEFIEKFPYNIGDKVYLFGNILVIKILETITNMHWCDKNNCVLYDTNNCWDLKKDNIIPYKEETMKTIETITIDDFKANTKEWLIDKLESMSKDNALQSICNIHDKLHKPEPYNMETIIKWQTGIPNNKGKYIITTKYKITSIDYYNKNIGWFNHSNEDIIAWCPITDIEPCKKLL